jgi:hypothetical protein
MNGAMRNILIGTLVAILPPAFAESRDDAPLPVTEKLGDPVGSVDLTGKSVAVGLGYSWGEGTLSFKDAKHHFHIKGLSVADVGATSMSAIGSVYHLQKVSDFGGAYMAVAAGAVLGGGGNAVYLKNSKGVILVVLVKETGLRFDFSAGSVNVKLTD